jgi:hypothetical protein
MSWCGNAAPAFLVSSNAGPTLSYLRLGLGLVRTGSQEAQWSAQVAGWGRIRNVHSVKNATHSCTAMLSPRSSAVTPSPHSSPCAAPYLSPSSYAKAPRARAAASLPLQAALALDLQLAGAGADGSNASNGAGALLFWEDPRDRAGGNQLKWTDHTEEHERKEHR